MDVTAVPAACQAGSITQIGHKSTRFDPNFGLSGTFVRFFLSDAVGPRFAKVISGVAGWPLLSD
jgi:hypothetical protein